MPEPASTKAVPTVLIDNERVRVTEWRFAAGAHTGHHRHEYPYVVVPMTTGPLAIRSAAGIEALVWLTDIAGLSRKQAAEVMSGSARALLRSALADLDLVGK